MINRMEHGLNKKKQLFSELSEPLNEPDYNRQVTILKEQVFTLINGQIDPLCRGQLTAWQRVFLGLGRHLSSMVQEVNAGQLRCALELDLLLWRVTDILGRYAGPMASSYALLAGEQAAWLIDLGEALRSVSSQSLRTSSRYSLTLHFTTSACEHWTRRVTCVLLRQFVFWMERWCWAWTAG